MRFDRWLCMIFGTGLLWLTAAEAGFSLEKNDILFYAPMDGTFKAAIAGGKADPVKEHPNLKFVEGHPGQGVLVGGPDSGLEYATGGNIQAEAGSVALWIKPVDWGKDDTWMRFYFRVHAGSPGNGVGPDSGDFAWLYKYFTVSATWLVQQDRPQRYFFSVSPASSDAGGLTTFDWEKGVWGHLIASWSGSQMSLYANGRYAGSTYVPTEKLLRAFAGVFTIGGASGRQPQPVPDTVIDEVMVLRVPVTPAEAQRIYEKGLKAFDSAEKSPPLLSMNAGYLLSSDKIRLEVAVVGRHPERMEKLEALCEVWKGDAQKPVRTERLSFGKKNRCIHELDGGALPKGKYRIVCKLREADREVAMTECEIEKGASPEWLGNSLGKQTDVPPPWTPIQVSENSLACWGRTYVWNQASLPMQIRSQEQDLLARPVTLSGVVEGLEDEFRTANFAWGKSRADRVEFKAAGSLGELPVRVRGWMEFDGFLWTEIEINGKGKTLDRLVLEIPLHEKAATLMHGFIPPPLGNFTGKVHEFQTALVFSPVFWVGNERCGLQLCMRDLLDCHIENPTGMFSLKKEEGEAVLRLVLIDHSTAVDRPLRFAVGLMATPVKPMPEDLRSWEMELSRNRTMKGQADVTGWGGVYWEQWNRIGNNNAGPRGYNVASDNTLKDLKVWYQSRGVKPWIYWAMNSVWCGDPVLKQFSAEWGGAYSDPAQTHHYSAVTPNRELASARDYSVWLIGKLIRDNPELAENISGFYWDCAQAGWNNDGVYTVLGTRELQKRLYRAIKKEAPNLRVMNHQSGATHMEQLAFADLYLTGEHLADCLRTEPNYHHVLSLDIMRAEYCGAKFGIPIIFLPELTRAVLGDEPKVKKLLGPEGIPDVEHLMGMLWVHDIMPYYAWCNTEPFQRATRAKDAFGWDKETRFLGYWENDALVRAKASRENVAVSLFIRKDRALFVAMNDSDTDATVELSPDWRKLEITPPAVLVDVYAQQNGEKDAPMPQAAPVKDGVAQFVVKARNFRALAANTRP